jgi:hypothetical protein
MNFEKSENKVLENNEQEKSESKFEFDKSMIPEGWVEDITDAQKEAYRIKVIAETGNYYAEKFWGKEHKDQPSAEELEFARREYEHLQLGLKGDPDLPMEKGQNEVTKSIDALSDYMRNAYLDWRARKYAKQDREQGRI